VRDLYKGDRPLDVSVSGCRQAGSNSGFWLSERRDVAAAKAFSRKALKHNEARRVITLAAYAASHRAVRELKTEGKMPKRVRVRSSKYLNNGIEQDHRRAKQRIRPMLGFKQFQTAAVTISEIELAAKIRKHQFKLGMLSAATGYCAGNLVGSTGR
jgi:transposase-like protein